MLQYGRRRRLRDANQPQDMTDLFGIGIACFPAGAAVRVGTINHC